MSGQLVGEVLAAAAHLKQRGLPRNAFAALVAIAEKCHVDTRQGSVPWSHIRAGIYEHNSQRSAERAVEALKKAGLVSVIRGFNNQAGRIVAPIYTIQQLIEPATQGGGNAPVDNLTEPATQGGVIGEGANTPKSGPNTPKSGGEPATQGGVLNGYGSTNRARGGIPPVLAGSQIRPSGSQSTSPRCNGPNCSVCQIIRTAITQCPDCDDYGRLPDLSDCGLHGNFRTHVKRKATA